MLLPKEAICSHGQLCIFTAIDSIADSEKVPINMLRTLKGTTVKKPGWEERNKLEGIMRKYSEKLRMHDIL